MTVESEFYRSGTHIVRRPAGNDEYLTVTDDVLVHVLYKLHATNLSEWNLTFPDVYSWTEQLSGGTIPLGFDTVDQFEDYLRERCGERYQKAVEENGRRFRSVNKK